MKKQFKQTYLSPETEILLVQTEAAVLQPSFSKAGTEVFLTDPEEDF